MKLTVFASRADAQVTKTAQGSMKLAAVEHRTPAVRVNTAAVRKASQG